MRLGNLVNNVFFSSFNLYCVVCKQGTLENARRRILLYLCFVITNSIDYLEVPRLFPDCYSSVTTVHY